MVHVLTDFIFIVEAVLDPVRCLLISREFTSNYVFGKVTGLFESQEQRCWEYFSQGLILFKYRL